MAQITRASFKTAKNTRYATNGIGAITGTVTRAPEEDTADSVVFLSDDISTNADFTVDGTKLTDRATIKTLVDVGQYQSLEVEEETAPFISRAFNCNLTIANSKMIT